jgi:16S rRNA (guanine527-N7)-methyltransferase
MTQRDPVEHARAEPGAQPDRGQVATRLTTTLAEAQRLGFLGPGPVAAHIDHAWPLTVRLPPTGCIADLGSGGGVPALILALAVPDTRWLLIESQRRRSAFLRKVVEDLGIGDRTEIVEARAEEVGRGERRGVSDAVTARSFAPPGVTAECAAPLLRPSGSLWVAEPPAGSGARWPEDGLAELGLVRGMTISGWAQLRQDRDCPDRYPRRVGVPAKRPLF